MSDGVSLYRGGDDLRFTPAVVAETGKPDTPAPAAPDPAARGVQLTLDIAALCEHLNALFPHPTPALLQFAARFRAHAAAFKAELD